MIHLIVGSKGKGKTKHLLDKVNQDVTSTSGNIVYLDKNSDNMYELNNKVRLINVLDYFITNKDEFIGFISGIISQDNDLEKLYVDSLFKIACIGITDIVEIVNKMEQMSEQFKIDFVLSISANKDELPENLRSKVIVSL